MDDIPTGILTLLTEAEKTICLLSLDPNLTSVGYICFSITFKDNNWKIGSLLHTNITSTPACVQYWTDLFGDLNWISVWNPYRRPYLSNKVREVSYQRIHRYYLAKHSVLKFEKDICVNYSLCRSEPETMTHLFWDYPLTVIVWSEKAQYVTAKVDSRFLLC